MEGRRSCTYKTFAQTDGGKEELYLQYICKDRWREGGVVLTRHLHRQMEGERDTMIHIYPKQFLC